MSDRPRTSDGALEAELRRFIAEQGLAGRTGVLDQNPEFPRREFAAMGAGHWLGLSLPAQVGGRGLDPSKVGTLLHLLAGMTGTCFAKLALQPEFSSILAEHGSPELIDRYFKPLMAGRLLVGNHVTEPGAGSDVQALTTRAQKDGSEYIITGEKSQAAFAADADAAIVYARTADPVPGDPGITALVVDQNLPGVVRSVIPDMGERWMRRGTVRYEGVRVPETQRIGDEGRAFRYLRRELRRERALLACIYLGVARDSWRQTVEFVHGRRAFGQRLSTQQAVAFPLVEDQTRLDAAEGLAARVLVRLVEGQATDAEVARLKWYATEVSLTALDHAVQFHGGRGYAHELPHEQRWRDVRSGALAHGTSEIMRLVAARALFPRELPTRRAPAESSPD